MEYLIGVISAFFLLPGATLTGLDRDRALAVLGFKKSLWWIVLALVAHGVFDVFHAALVHNRGVPLWWPMFCLSFDLVAAAYLAWLLMSARVTAAPVVEFKH